MLHMKRKDEVETEIELRTTQVITRKRIGPGVWEERTTLIGEKPHQWIPGADKPRREGDD